MLALWQQEGINVHPLQNTWVQRMGLKQQRQYGTHLQTVIKDAASTKIVESGYALPVLERYMYLYTSASGCLLHLRSTWSNLDFLFPTGLGVGGEKRNNTVILIKRNLQCRCILNKWQIDAGSNSSTTATTKPLNLQNSLEMTY